jgi:2-polyprenyl-3-methyl-5-hydroxy-6-metoxy-1,4-benzoquinol methylase
MIDWQIRRRERLVGISDLLLISGGSAVLDAGCHRGLVGYEFAKHGAKLVHGVDIDPEVIKFAGALFSDVWTCSSRHEVVDLNRCSGFYQSYSYDVVLLLGVYHKLKRTGDARAVLGNLCRRTAGHLAWNGDENDFDEVDDVLTDQGLTLVSRSGLIQHTGIWKR